MDWKTRFSHDVDIPVVRMRYSYLVFKLIKKLHDADISSGKIFRGLSNYKHIENL